MTRAIVGMCAGAALMLCGCISKENDRVTVGRSLRLEAFTPAKPAEPVIVPPGLVERSLVTIERDNWQKTEILVPVDGTAHNPTYARRVNATSKTRRQRELFPTASSAMDLAGGSEGQQQEEALYNHLMFVADGLFLLPRMIWRAPWRTDASPDEAMSRYAHPELPPGQRQPLPEDTDPFAEPKPRSVTP